MRNIFLLSVLFITGCVSTAAGPVFKQVDNVADHEWLVYIYRQVSDTLQDKTAYFEVDGNPAAQLDNNGYTYLKLKLGRHVIKQNWSSLFVC